MFGSPFGSTGISTPFGGAPVSSFLPYPNSGTVQQGINQDASNLYGAGDLRSLFKQYGAQANSGISNDYKNEPGQMANLVAPRSQVASQVMQGIATAPYAANQANFNALMNLQGANANQAFGMNSIAQQLGQGVQGYQLGQYGGNLGFLQQLLGSLFGGLGGLMNNTMGGAGGGSFPGSQSYGGSPLGSLSGLSGLSGLTGSGG